MLNNREGKKVAVIVNDMSEINIDKSMVQNEVSLNHKEEKLVEMSNGCICCTLREDLLIEVAKLAKSGSFDYLVIESTGISEPLPVAETFTFEDESGISLSDVSKLDTMVTVVDAANFLHDYNEAEALQARGESLGEEDTRTVTDLLIDQIEFADVIVLNKLDLVNDEQANQVEAIISALNPGAEIIPTTHSKVSLDRVLDTKLFDYEKAENSAGWIRELQGEHTPETEEYGISSFTYRTSKPFDAEKLHEFVREKGKWAGILRSKGFFWISANPRYAYQWAQAGGVSNVSIAGIWWAAAGDQVPDLPDEQRPDMQPDWDENYGDRKQTLVFIGQDMDEDFICRELDSCLYDDGSDKPDLDSWIGQYNPFPTMVADSEGNQ